MREPDVMAELAAIAARVLPGSGPPRIERTASGGSTPVYRLQRGGVTCYLRLSETPGQSLAAEALAHTLMRERGIRVPEVVELEPFNDVLGRAVMVTDEIPGEPLRTNHQGIDAAAVLTAAGRDLAAMHEIAVAGFGWVRRDRHEPSRLEASLPALAAFALDGLDEHLASLAGVLTGDEIAAIENTLAPGVPALAGGRATLVHGDFDASHIFHREGVYTGIIDFGEIRGADPFYDLGHFALHDGEFIPFQAMPALLKGYQQVTRLPPDHEAGIRIWSLLIGVRSLARSMTRPRGPYRDHLTRAIRATLATR